MNNELNFLKKIWRNFKMVLGDYCDIITGDETKIYHRTIRHKSENASWLGQDESPTTVVRRSKFEGKNLFIIFFKSNGLVLIHCVDEGKAINHNYDRENCLKPVVKETWNQEGQQVHKVSNCFTIMLDPIFIPTLLII